MSCATADAELQLGEPELSVQSAPARGTSAKTLDPTELRELMIRYQAGDSAAVESFVVRLSPALLRFLSAPNLARDVAEDVLQDFWLRLHRARHTYRASEPVLPWVYAIARHTALDSYRRRQRVQSRELTVETMPETPYRDRPARPRDSGVMRALDRLPEGQREVVLMLKVTGMSLEEVARAMSTSVGSIKQRAHRAYRRLRVLLEADQTRPAQVSGPAGIRTFGVPRPESAA